MSAQLGKLRRERESAGLALTLHARACPAASTLQQNLLILGFGRVGNK